MPSLYDTKCWFEMTPLGDGMGRGEEEGGDELLVPAEYWTLNPCCRELGQLPPSFFFFLLKMKFSSV